MHLPPQLQNDIDRLAAAAGGIAVLARDSAAVTARYRDRTANLQIATPAEAVAYAVARLPATYAAAAHVLEQLQIVWPEMTPATILDVGAGPGTVTLAALERWPDLKARLLEPNVHLAAVGRTLAGEGACAWEATTLQSWPGGGQDYDLVTAGYVFNEIADPVPQILKLWESCRGAMVLIEPGTPLGFRKIIEAREALLSAGAHIAAPCPHSFDCPLAHSSETRWCHFSARVERSRLHRQVKADAVLGYEDEKFSYLIATRRVLPRPQSRAIGHPHGQKVVSLELCRDSGSAETCRVSKRDAAYKAFRKAEWGDGLYSQDCENS